MAIYPSRKEGICINYLNDPDPEKHETITLEELAAREGIRFC